MFLRKLKMRSVEGAATTKEAVPTTLTLSRAKQATAKMAGLGYLNVLQWLRANKCAWDEDVMSEAALHGHLFVMKWAYEHGAPFDNSACENAAYGGQISCLQYCLEHDFPKDMSIVVIYAAKGQHLNILQWLSKTQTGFAVHPDCIVIAILGSPFVGAKDDEGHNLIQLIECIYENATDANSLLNGFACTAAVRRGRLECLQWLRRFGCPWDYRILTAAHEIKNKSLLHWIMKNGGARIQIPVDKRKIKYKAFTGQQEKVSIMEKIRLKNEREKLLLARAREEGESEGESEEEWVGKGEGTGERGREKRRREEERKKKKERIRIIHCFDATLRQIACVPVYVE
jgi:hypothetical protein